MNHVLSDLLRRCGLDEEGTADRDAPHSVTWDGCGAAALTAGGAAPDGDVAGRMAAAAAALQIGARRLGVDLVVDGAALLCERAQLTGTTTSPAPGETLRGYGRLLRTRDGWLALNLARPTDRQCIPALTGDLTDGEDPDALAAWAAQTATAAALERALLLDLPAAALPKSAAAPVAPFRLRDTQPTPRRMMSDLRVCDLSSLWAGPLIGAMLAEMGADVEKLESEARPETPDSRDRAFAQRLNGRKRRIVLDFEDRSRLHSHVVSADVVITSARTRALASLGLRHRPGQLWLQVTAHGAKSDRAGFGDDAAVAGGAVAWLEDRPVFAADALADPVTGLLGATAAVALLAAERTAAVELSLARSARWANSRPARHMTGASHR